MHPPKKILIIASEFPPDVGGIGNHAYLLAKNLSLEGFDVSVMADQLSENKNPSHPEGFLFQFFPLYRRKTAAVTYFNRIVTSLKLVNKNEVIFCSGKFPLWLILPNKWIYPHKKFIAIVHGSELTSASGFARRLTHLALEKFHSIVAVSGFTKNLVPRHIRDHSFIRIIPNGINLNEFGENKPVKNLVDKNEQTIHLITVGSVTERKGQENVIRALPAILPHFPFLKYHVVGKPVLQHKLMPLIRELAVEDHVIFHGMVSRQKLSCLLNMADLKLMLSINTSNEVEGFGIAILEANAAGKPAIGSMGTGIEDAIRDGWNGKLVDPNNPAQIADAVKEIMAHYSSYSRNAMEWAKEHDWKNLVKEYVKIIK